MYQHFSNDYRSCGFLGKNVSMALTEGQCRGRHNCGHADCPLAARFSQPSFAGKNRGLCRTLGVSWLCG